MWLFFPFGFVSVVHKPGDEPGVLCVRARDALSLDNVRARCPTLGPTLSGGGTDYPFRAYVNATDFGAFMADYTASIDFGNFKDQTTRQHGRDYHDACMSVWGAMLRISPPQRFGGWRRNDGPPPDYVFGPPYGEPLDLFPALPATRKPRRHRPRHRPR
jgi:hypothetical protein